MGLFSSIAKGISAVTNSVLPPKLDEDSMEVVALLTNTYKYFIESTEEIKKCNADISNLINMADITLMRIKDLLNQQSIFEQNTLTDITQMQNPNSNLVFDINKILVQLHEIKYNYPILNTNQMFNKFYNQIIDYSERIHSLKSERNEKVQNYRTFIQQPKTLLVLGELQDNAIVSSILNEIDDFANYE